MTSAIVVLVTAGSAAQAEALADILVGERLAACVNLVGPIRSIYRWQDKVERDSETLLVIKTTAAHFDRLADRVRAVHSYENPEIVALPITQGSDPYLRWLAGATGSPD